MSEPFLAEIRMFGGFFAPRGWAFCDGRLLPVNQYDALFSLVGNIYGGDGRSTFGLPDLRGRLPIGTGQGPGLSNRRLGSSGGTERVTLSVDELPQHNHTMLGSTQNADIDVPLGAVPAITDGNSYNAGGALVSMPATTATGGGQSHSNLMPYTCINFIIALQGVYPSRS